MNFSRRPLQQAHLGGEEQAKPCACSPAGCSEYDTLSIFKEPNWLRRLKARACSSAGRAGADVLGQGSRVHLRFTRAHFSSSGCREKGTLLPPARAARGGRVLGWRLSTSKMAPARREPKKRDLKWIFSFAAPSTPAAMPTLAPPPPARCAHASPSQLAPMEYLNRSIPFLLGRCKATGQEKTALLPLLQVPQTPSQKHRQPFNSHTQCLEATRRTTNKKKCFN